MPLPPSRRMGQGEQGQGAACVWPASVFEAAIMACDPYHGKPGCRIRPLGIPATTIEAASPGTVVTIEAQNKFVGFRIVIPSDIAFDCELANVEVGMASQLAARSGNIPCACFTEVAVDTKLLLDPIVGNTQLILTVANLTAEELRFAGAVFGITTADYSPN